MRSKLLFLIMLIAVLTALSGTVCAANLAVNEGFEEPSPASWAEWSCSVSGSCSGDGTTNYRENDPCARTGDDCMEAVGDTYGFSYQDYATNAVGQDYTLAAYFKDVHPGGSAGPVQLTLEYRDMNPRDGDAFYKELYEPTIPNDGQWHLVQLTYTTPANTELITICVGKGGSEGTFLYDDVWFDTIPPGGAHNPQPPNNSKVQAPGLVDLKWENSTAQTCTVYWDNGSADVNDLNFQWHMGNTSEVTLIGTVAGSDPNQILNNSVAADKNYHWRVDVGSLAGIVWNFSTINTAPDVDAGPKQAKWLASGGGSVTFPLAPTVSDDGLPIPPGALEYLWTKTGGSGAVTFSPNATTKDATASMSVADDYELTLTVSDDGAPGPGDPNDFVLIRVHANATTGLEARYDCEEGNAAAGIHDFYSGHAKNPPTNPADPPNDSRRGERMDDIDKAGTTTGTTMDGTGGHNVAPVRLPGDLTKGGIVFDGVSGHVEAYNSSGDPNFESAKWADFRDEVTVGAWIKVDTENGGWDDNWECVINKGENSYRLHRNSSGDSIQMTINIDDAESVAAGTTAVNDGEWHHVMGTYDGAQVCIYVDGLQEACVDAEGQIDWVTGAEGDNPALTFGQSKEYDAPFGGTMDEIRIHSIGLPWQSDNPEAVPVTEINARSVVSIYRTSDGHVNCGGTYLPGDANEDCFVNMDDVKAMAGNWMECNSIAEPRCD